MADFIKKLKQKRKPFVSAVVAAGGTGTRMGENKLLMDLCGMPVLARTLIALEKCEMIDEIVISAHKDSVLEYGQLAKKYGIKKLKCVVTGGENRSISVFKGISAVSENCRFVAIHDGARPFITNEEIEKVISKAFYTGAATASVPVKDTIKQIADDKIAATIERATLVQVQTPQVFDIDLIKGALTKVIAENISVTDDCQAMEVIGFNPTVVTTSYDNIKITTPEDILLGQLILNKRGE
ncbi:MAG: 2-C-methyl-D-erythritol 4-phosphate cytidylyltransferase [Clostridia bacterium]|nr:2-C-methyl-D-erythritol 4-phosphate cytidylyltransferase [Clostridia bacterium]